MYRSLIIVLITLIMFLFALTQPAYGAQAVIYDLTDEQAAKLELEGAQMKASPAFSVQQAEEHAIFGKQIAEAIGAAAKEMGVAVGEFVKTPVGKITTAIIVYKLVGRDLLHYAGGVVHITIALLLMPWFFGKRTMPREITYNEAGKKISDKSCWPVNSSDTEHQDCWRAANLAYFVINVGCALTIFWT